MRGLPGLDGGDPSTGFLRQASFDKLRMNEGEREKEIITGSLRCAKCNVTYHITDSIPNLLPPETTST